MAGATTRGYITYKQRLKRMIVTSGYNVYPSQIEEVIERHEAVVDCSVIGVPHPYKVEVAKAYIALKAGYKDTPKLREELTELCKKNLAAYSIPKEFEREFSRGCLERSLMLWDGSNLLIRDLPEEIIGTNKNDEVVKVLRKETERI